MFKNQIKISKHNLVSKKTKKKLWKLVAKSFDEKVTKHIFKSLDEKKNFFDDKIKKTKTHIYGPKENPLFIDLAG
jgi:hypothetical protein